MKRMMMLLSVAALLVALTASAAFAVTKYGTAAGDGLYGTSQADTIYGYGGTDLIYGYGGADTLYGGNERGWGDKILGGSGADEVRGEGGDDALYGDRGNDKVLGGAGNDLVVGGSGNDTINSGPGPDTVNAQDGQKDTIICGNEAEEVYYDRGLDVLQGCLGMNSSDSEATLSAQSTQQAPEGLFEHTGKVLVDHDGAKKCVAEKELKGHLNHGDEILNPAGCSSAEAGRS